MIGIALNVYALALFGRDSGSAVPWLPYVASLVLALAGLWKLTMGTGEKAAVGGEAIGRREIILLGLIVALGAFFRLYQLDAQPAGFFYDEAMYGLDAGRVLRGEAYPVYFEANYGRGALFIYLAAAAMKLLGSGALALRLVSVVIGVLTIPALYGFTRLLFGSRPALVAAFLLAVSRWHVNFSRIAFDAILLPLLELAVFYFLFRGLRSRQTMDFVWAGVAAGLGLNTYVAFRLVPLIAAAYVVFYLLRERRLHRDVAVGLGALALSGLLVTSPFLQFYIQHPKIVNQRAEVVNVFAGKTMEGGVQAALENTRKHLLMFNARGDPNGRHNLPGEPMLDFATAALFALGAGYTLCRARRPENAFLLIWLAAMLAAGILSVDFEAPQALRSIGALPVAIIFAGIPISHLLRLSHTGRVLSRSAVLVALVLLGYAGLLNFQNYFQRQAVAFPSWANFSTGEAFMAREMRALGPDWQYYVTSLFYDHPTVRFLAPGIRGYRRIEATDYLPIREAGDRNVAIFLDPQKPGLFAAAQRYYPRATFKQFTPPFGGPPVLLEALLRKEDIQSVQGLAARYFAGDAWAGAPLVERRDAVIAFDWGSAAPLPAPFSVEWQGALYVASYGEHTLGIRSPGQVEVWLDERQVLKQSGDEVRVRLAKGNHTLRVRAVVPRAAGRTELYWQPPGGGIGNIAQSAFYAPPVSNNGLLGSYYPNLSWAGEPALQQIDPTLALYFHVTLLPRPYTVEWLGKVEAPVAGDYGFGLESIDDSWLEIDGRPVVEAHVHNRYEEGRVALSAGWHDLRVRYIDRSGWSHVNLFWRPPGGERQIVPAERLLPPQGSYPAAPAIGGLAPKPAPSLPQGGVPVAGGATLLRKLGEAESGAAQLRQPKDLVIAPDGTIYVADTGNGRVVRFDREGRFLGQIGEPGTGPGQLESPNALALAPDGDLLVLDEPAGYVSRFAPYGSFRQRFAGPQAGFFHPRGLAVGPDGTIYVADTGHARVVVYSPEGNKRQELGGKGGGAGQMLGPVGITVDSEGMLWLADVDNKRVQRLSPEGRYLGGFEIPPGESVDGAHLGVGTSGIYVTDPARDRVLVYSFEGRLLGQWGERGEGEGQLRRPVGIAVDRDGSVWVAERDNHRVQQFQPPQ